MLDPVSCILTRWWNDGMAGILLRDTDNPRSENSLPVYPWLSLGRYENDCCACHPCKWSIQNDSSINFGLVHNRHVILSYPILSIHHILALHSHSHWWCWKMLQSTTGTQSQSSTRESGIIAVLITQLQLIWLGRSRQPMTRMLTSPLTLVRILYFHPLPLVWHYTAPIVGFYYFGIKRSRGGFYQICIDCYPDNPQWLDIDGVNSTDDGHNPPVS